MIYSDKRIVEVLNKCISKSRDTCVNHRPKAADGWELRKSGSATTRFKMTLPRKNAEMDIWKKTLFSLSDNKYLSLLGQEGC